MQLHFFEFGSPSAEPLIILHGFFASSRNWRRIAEQLSSDFHVLLPDMRNHGTSPHHPIMDYPAMADDLQSLIDGFGFSKINLMGHSMGGKAAMWFALNHRERVDCLVVADIAPIAYSHSFVGTIEALKSVPLAQLKNRKQAEEWLSEAIPELSYRQFLLQNLVLDGNLYRWRVDLDIFSAWAPYVTAFPEARHLDPYTGNTLFIAGANSDFVKERDIRPLFPEAELWFIEGAGHWLHVQQPEMFIDKVGNFLKFC